MVAAFRAHLPTSIGERKIAHVQDLMQAGTGLPKANVLILEMEDQSKVIIRPSGTEPKIKIYGHQKKLHAKCITKSEIDSVDRQLQKLLEETKKILRNGSNGRPRT